MILVYLNDQHVPYEHAEEHFAQAAAWAREHCASFVDYHVQDTSDVSYQYDFVTQYRFRDHKDAAWFELKWKK